MQRIMAKSKIHRGVITFTDVDYEGSISIDKNFIKKVDILPGEKVLVVDIDNGNRFETYVIEAEENSKEIGINGGAARLVKKGDKCIILAFANYNENEMKDYKMKIIVLNNKNEIINEFTRSL